MPKTTLTLSESIAKTLKVYTAQPKKQHACPEQSCRGSAKRVLREAQDIKAAAEKGVADAENKMAHAKADLDKAKAGQKK